MALSYVQYLPDQATQVFAVPFPYLKKEHVHAYVDGVEDINITWDNDSIVRLSAQAPAGSVVTVRRLTPKDQLSTNYNSGALLDEPTLDNAQDELFYIIQEGIEKADEALTKNVFTGQWDLQAGRVTNMADPVDPQDAVTKGWLDANYVTLMNSLLAQTTAKATSADESEAAALSYRDQSQTIFNNVVTEGATQTNRVTAEGNTQFNRVHAEGDTQDARIIAQGDTQNARLISTGDAKVALATTEADRATTEANRAQTEADRADTEADRAAAEAIAAGNFGTNKWHVTTLTGLSAATLDCSLYDTFWVQTMDRAVALTLSNMVPGKTIMILRYNSPAVHALTFPGMTVWWPGGVPPVWSGYTDILVLTMINSTLLAGGYTLDLR